MASVTQPSEQQTQLWLRGLISVAWADGVFTQEEQELIHSLTQQDFEDSDSTAKTFEPVTPEALAAGLGHDSHAAENFLRMAVMVALVDRSYSDSEDALLNQYCQALGLETTALEALRKTLSQVCAEADAAALEDFRNAAMHGESSDHLLHPVKDWLDKMEIHDPKVAHFLCRMIPPQCPFERDVVLFGKKVAHIPAMCKLNPLYEQFVGLRFRALSYLADECGEDVSPYC